MDYNYWIEYFINMDSEQIPLIKPIVFIGSIPKSAIQFNEPLFIQQIFELKQRIGLLPNSSQLKYLKNLSINNELPFISNDVRHKKIAQSFYQPTETYLGFIEAYKNYLIQDMDKDFYRDISLNIYSKQYAKDSYTLDEFIEAKHDLAKDKGNRFYILLSKGMIREGANDYQMKLFKEVQEYCKLKIEGKEFIFFPENIDLLPEYYKRKEAVFIAKQRESKSSLFDEIKCKEDFKLKEIEFVKSRIKDREQFCRKEENGNITGLATLRDEVFLYHEYLSWINKQPTNFAGIENIPFETMKRIEQKQNYQKALQDLENKFQIDYVLTKTDLENYPFAKVGDIVRRNPERPNDPKAAFELFKNYHAAIQFEVYKYLFEIKGNVWNEACISAEIENIELFINEAKKIDKDYCLRDNNNTIQNPTSHPHEYKRIDLGFYKDNLISFDLSSLTAKIYGKCFLFYEYLKERLSELQPTAPTTNDQQQANKVSTPNNLEQMENINHFNKFMPIELAENHFKVFTDAKHKKGNTPFLSKEAFEQFIKKAFHGKSEIEKQKLNVGTREKWFIVKRFYEFYKIGIGENEGLQYETTTQCREKYIRLLTDNFTNWSYNEIENNFNKEVKRAW